MFQFQSKIACMIEGTTSIRQNTRPGKVARGSESQKAHDSQVRQAATRPTTNSPQTLASNSARPTCRIYTYTAHVIEWAATCRAYTAHIIRFKILRNEGPIITALSHSCDRNVAMEWNHESLNMVHSHGGSWGVLIYGRP